MLFSFRMNDNNSTTNFNSFWKHILDNPSFLSNICSINFINHLVSFNCLIVSKKKEYDVFKEMPWEIKVGEIFEKEISTAKHVLIETEEHLALETVVSLLERKRSLSNKINLKKEVEATVQIAKYYAVSLKRSLFIETLLTSSTLSYFEKFNQTNSVDSSTVCFKILSSLLFHKRMFILSFICAHLSEE